MEDGKMTSVLQLPASILVIPQATLGGRLKGQRMQYHNNIEKTAGLELYTQFVEAIQQVSAANDAWTEKGCVVKSGTYGNRQVLKIDTNGPYTHLIEFWHSCFTLFNSLKFSRTWAYTWWFFEEQLGLMTFRYAWQYVVIDNTTWI